jgi:hypothetical protein
VAHEHAVERSGVRAPATGSPRRRDTLEVVEVRYDQEPVTLVVKGTAARATSAAAVLGIRNCRLAQAPGC